MKCLRVDQIHLNRDKPILKNVSFSLEKGEILICLGPSGCGKTSLLRCLNRLETIESGNIFLHDTDIRNIRGDFLRRRVALVFQVPALVPGTVLYNITLGPRLQKKDLLPDEALKLMDKVGLEQNLASRDVETLSVGQRQLIALAQALANRPDLLMLDEPTSALDPASVLKIEQCIRDICHNTNTSIILVTHNLAQARRFNARTLLLIDGTVAACGNLEDIINQADSPALESYFKPEET